MSGLRARTRRVAAGLGGQAVWSILDQAVSSLGTLVLSVAVAQRSDVAGFGAFAAMITVYALVLTGSRAFVSMPYLMRAADPDGADPDGADRAGGRGLVAGTLGAAVLAAAPVSGGLLVAAAVTAAVAGGPLPALLAVLAAAMPFLLLQDAYRFVLRQREDSRGVAVNDTIWTAVQAAASVSLVTVPALGPAGDTAIAHVGAWVLGVVVAVGHGLRRTGTAPSLAGGWRFLRRTRRQGVPLLVEAFAIAGSNSTGQFAIGAVGGLAALAPIKGAHVALGPVNVVNGGLVFLATPIVLRAGATDRRRLLGLCGAFGLVIGAVSAAAGLLLLAVPAEVGALLLGQTWSEARAAVLPTALALGAYGAQTAAMLGFRAHRITTRTMVLRLVTFPVPAVAGVVGLFVNGPVGAAYGLFAAASVTAALLWTVLVRLPAAPPVPAGDGDRVAAT
ncbi:MAG TPA: hypothetical protein VD813_07645 [Pseudonocardia sp.]|nr:hypothetical protein [Pseudonocardia sp.]